MGGTHKMLCLMEHLMIIYRLYFGVAQFQSTSVNLSIDTCIFNAVTCARHCIVEVVCELRIDDHQFLSATSTATAGSVEEWLRSTPVG